MRTAPIRDRASRILGRGREPGWRPAHACGAVGRFDPARVAAIAALMPATKKVELTGNAALMLDRDPIAWQDERRSAGFAWSESPATPNGPAPRTRKAVARDHAASGIEFEGERVTVHASGLGLQPLYVQREGEATYFCSRLAPLADASPAPLAIDWAAWSAILEFGCPMGVRTGFEGIERLEPGTWISHDRGAGGVLGSDGWSWAEFHTADRDDPVGDILDAVRAAVAAIPTPRGRAVCPLSGGWDSRLIAALLQQSSTRVRSLTVNTDAGHELEESLAGPVAEGLGIDHELIRPRNTLYWEDWRAAAALQEHQSPIHLPMQGLAQSIPAGPDPIFDGVSGDVLIKGWWVDKRILGAPSWHRASRMLWRRFRLNKGGLRMLSTHHANAMRSSARSQFMAEAKRFDGHESAPTLFISWARSRRSTTPSPFDLFGARGPVALPFALDSVAEAALSVGSREKLGGDLYRALLERADPRLAAWPSTSDVGAPAEQRHRRRRTLSGAAVEGYRETLRNHPLRSSFSGVFEQQVESGRIRHMLRHRQGLVALDSLCRFADWHQRHQGSLKPFEPADLKQL